MRIAVLDYGMGNIGSIINMLKKAGADNAIVAVSSEEVETADKLILPGVGAFDSGMKALQDSGLRDALDRAILIDKKPILGICLGMQLLGQKSEEGKLPGLGYLPFSCKHFYLAGQGLAVPHMGWDYVSTQMPCDAFSSSYERPKYYFVHSYYAVCDDDNISALTCEYGIAFTAAVHKDNIYGTQFHPEKSHVYGLELMKHFIEV